MKKVIATKNAPGAVGPYSQAIEVNGMVFVSGQIPLVPETGAFISEDIKDQTKQVLENIKNILAEAGLDMSNVVKSTCLLADINDFAAMNEVYATYFEEPYPARAAFGVADIPKGAKVEIEVIAVR